MDPNFESIMSNESEGIDYQHKTSFFDKRKKYLRERVITPEMDKCRTLTLSPTVSNYKQAKDTKRLMSP